MPRGKKWHVSSRDWSTWQPVATCQILLKSATSRHFSKKVPSLLRIIFRTRIRIYCQKLIPRIFNFFKNFKISRTKKKQNIKLASRVGGDPPPPDPPIPSNEDWFSAWMPALIWGRGGPGGRGSPPTRLTSLIFCFFLVLEILKNLKF